MKAVVKTAPGVGNVEYMDVPEPQIAPQGVKVEVAYSGICGTDIHVYYDRFRNYPPVILGHEFSGLVVETGPQVRGVRPGERVTVLPSSAVVCGTCPYCVRGYYMFCPVRRGMGHGVNGSFTRYVAVREDQVYKIPESLSMRDAAVTEAFASAANAIEELTDFHPGEVVLLSGPGPIGLLSLLLLLAHGCRVIVAGAKGDEVRMTLAKRLGADVVVDASEVEDAVAKETDGRGVDAVVEASGNPASVAACLKAVRPLGTYIQVGIVGREFSIPFDLLLYKQVRLFGSLGHSLRTWQRVMRIIEQGKIDIGSVVSHELPLSCWRQGFDLCESKQGIKVMLRYDGEDAR